MAYAPEDPRNQQVQDQEQTGAMPSTSSAPGSSPGAAASKSVAAQASPAQPFQNLQAYLSANAPQIQQQANTISGNLQNQYGQIQSDINKGVSNFGQQVQSGYAQPNQELINQAGANPAEFVKNPNNVKGFQDLYNNVYAGPNNFETSGTYGDLNASVNKAMSDATLMKSNAGIQTYLQGKNPNSTKGGTILDSVLMQGSPEAYGKIKSAAKPFEGLSDYLNQSTTSANQAVPAAQQTAKDISSNLQKQFTGEGGIIPKFQSDLDTRVAQAREEAARRSNTAHDVLEAGNPGGLNSTDVTDPMLSDLGLTRDQYYSILTQRDIINNSPNQVPIDLDPYLGLTRQSPDVFLHRGNVATPDDYAKADALSKLTGQDFSGFLNPSDILQAGKENRNLNSINPANIKALNDLYASIPQGPQPLPGVNPGPPPIITPTPITPPESRIPGKPIEGIISTPEHPVIAGPHTPEDSQAISKKMDQWQLEHPLPPGNNVSQRAAWMEEMKKYLASIGGAPQDWQPGQPPVAIEPEINKSGGDAFQPVEEVPMYWGGSPYKKGGPA